MIKPNYNLTNHSLAIELDKTQDLVRIYEFVNSIEWQYRTFAEYPSETRVKISRAKISAEIQLSIKVYFGFLKREKICEDLFELINKNFNTPSVAPLRFEINDYISNDIWMCSVVFEANESCIKENSVATVFIQANLVADELARSLTKIKPSQFNRWIA